MDEVKSPATHVTHGVAGLFCQMRSANAVVANRFSLRDVCPAMRDRVEAAEDGEDRAGRIDRD